MSWQVSHSSWPGRLRSLEDSLLRVESWQVAQSAPGLQVQRVIEAQRDVLRGVDGEAALAARGGPGHSRHREGEGEERPVLCGYGRSI